MLAIAEDPPKTKSPWKRLPVKILDGKTGTAQRFWIRVKALDASIQTSEWQLLFSASPSPAELRSFVPASPDLFYGPWR